MARGWSSAAPSRSTISTCSAPRTRSSTGARRRSRCALRVHSPPRHPKTEGYYILHEAISGSSAIRAEGRQLQESRREERDPVQGDERLARFHRQVLGGNFAADTKANLNAAYSANAAANPKSYQTDYVLDAQTIAPGASGAADFRLFAGAKEVQTIDAYDRRSASTASS